MNDDQGPGSSRTRLPASELQLVLYTGPRLRASSPLPHDDLGHILAAIAAAVRRLERRLDAIENRQAERDHHLFLAAVAITSIHAQGGITLQSILQALETGFNVFEGQLGEIAQRLSAVAEVLEASRASSDRQSTLFQAQLLRDIAAMVSTTATADGWTTMATNDILRRLDVLAAGVQLNAARTEQASLVVRDAVVVAVAGLCAGYALVSYRYDLVLPYIYLLASLLSLYAREIYPVFAATVLALIWLTL